MADANRERPATDEAPRTGRDERATGAPSVRRDGLSENDAPRGGVDSADFPGIAAP